MATTAATIDMPVATRERRLSPGFACSPTGNAQHVIRANHARDAIRGRSITHEPSVVTIPDHAPAFVRVLLGLQAMWAQVGAPRRIWHGLDDESSVDGHCGGS